MKPYTVIIPSCKLSNVQACLASIEQHQPGADVVVIANGDLLGHSEDLEKEKRCCVAKWHEPFNFAACINAGAARSTWINPTHAAPDILILNDDTRLLTINGFGLLQQAAYDHPECGLMFPSVTGCTGNPGDHLQQPGGGIRHAKRHVVPFIGVYIRRAVWNQIGRMDKDFNVDYGFEDAWYCTLVRAAGYQLGIYDGCILEHGLLPSAYRSSGNCSWDGNRKVYQRKWEERFPGMPVLF